MQRSQLRTVGRLVLTTVLALALVWFVTENRSMVRSGLASLSAAHPAWVLACAVLSLGALATMSEVMFALMRAGGVSLGRRQAWALTYASNSWSTTLPGGPALSTVFQFQVQRSWGASIVVISWFVLLSSAISSMWLATLGIASVVFLGASFSLTSLIGVGVLMVALAVFVHWLATHPLVLERGVVGVLRWLNLLLRRSHDHGMDMTSKHIQQLDAVRLSLPKFLGIALLSLANRLCDLLTLWAAVAAVTGDIPAIAHGASGINIAGITLAYTSAKIIGATGVTPGGIGPVEAAITATLAGAGMDPAQALAAALVYRMISFIFITAVGWVVYAVEFRRTPSGIPDNNLV